MKYALLIYDDPQVWAAMAPDQKDAIYAEHGRLMEALNAKSACLYATELDQAPTARTVRRVDGASLSTDGPFTELTEHISGFYIVEAADLDEAIGYAGILSGTVEIRPLEAR